MEQSRGVGKGGQLGAASRVTIGHVYPGLNMPGTVTNSLFYLLNPQNKSEASTKESILELGVLDPRKVEQQDTTGQGLGWGVKHWGRGLGTGCADSRPSLMTPVFSG